MAVRGRAGREKDGLESWCGAGPEGRRAAAATAVTKCDGRRPGAARCGDARPWRGGRMLPSASLKVNEDRRGDLTCRAATRGGAVRCRMAIEEMEEKVDFMLYCL